MEKVHFEIGWHILGDQARVINLKGFLTSEEILNLYGIEFFRKYFFIGTSCSFDPKPQHTKKKSPRINYDREIVDPLMKSQRSESGFLFLWDTVSLSKMEFYNEIVAEANEHFNELAKQLEKSSVDERER
jgi:hypothetical protein